MKSQKESFVEIPKQEAESIISSSAISKAGEEGNAEQLDPLIQADLTPESPDIIEDSTNMTPPQRGEFPRRRMSSLVVHKYVS